MVVAKAQDMWEGLVGDKAENYTGANERSWDCSIQLTTDTVELIRPCGLVGMKLTRRGIQKAVWGPSHAV